MAEYISPGIVWPLDPRPSTGTFPPDVDARVAGQAPYYGGLPQSGTVNIDPGSALPKLPQLPSISDALDKANAVVLDTIAKGLEGTPFAGLAPTVRLLAEPSRIITIGAGLLFIAGGLYILGSGQISEAVRDVVRVGK